MVRKPSRSQELRVVSIDYHNPAIVAEIKANANPWTATEAAVKELVHYCMAYNRRGNPAHGEVIEHELRHLQNNIRDLAYVLGLIPHFHDLTTCHIVTLCYFHPATKTVW